MPCDCGCKRCAEEIRETRRLLEELRSDYLKTRDERDAISRKFNTFKFDMTTKIEAAIHALPHMLKEALR